MKSIFTPLKYMILPVLIMYFSNVIEAQQTVTGSILHGGINRTYRLRLPANFNKVIAIPMVFNFHGFGSNALEQEFYTGMNSVADTAGFAVCYPQGIGNAWNVGWAFGSSADDVGLTSALIEDLNIKYGFDKNRIYSCGMSNGGFMSYTLACELNNKIAAIASVTGSMVPEKIGGCKPGRPVPVMEIHGNADSTVLYTGSPIAVSIPDVLNFWKVNNGCDAQPIKEMVPNVNSFDDSTAERYTYVNCTENNEVIHYKIIGGAHSWPGSIIQIGVTNNDFNASATIWRFFKKYSLNKPTSIVEPITAENISIFPNPCYDEVIIDMGLTAYAKMCIISIHGNLIRSQLLTNGQNRINTSHLPAGMYIININGGKENKSYKLTKI